MLNNSRIIEDIPWSLYGVPENKDVLRRQLEEDKQSFRQSAAVPYFSLLTPLWNTPPLYLEQLIQTCLNQSFPSWELILLDDGSTNQEHYPLAQAHAAADARIIFKKLPTNQGISQARNAAFALSRGSYVGILDHDDCLHPRILAIYYNCIRASAKEPDLIYCNEVKVNADGKLLSDFFFKPAFDRQTLLRSNYIAHFAVVDRRRLDAMFARDGLLFSPQFDGVEDHEYFLRLSQSENFKAIHLPIFGYMWRKASTSTALQLSAKPYVKQRLLDMLSLHCGSSFQISGPETHPQCFPSLLPRAFEPLRIRVCVWGGNASTRKVLLEDLRQQQRVELIFYMWEEDQGENNAKLAAEKSLEANFTLLVHTQIELEDREMLFKLASHLQSDSIFYAAIPRVLGPQNEECGEWRLQPMANISAPWRARFEQLEQDFPADERLGAFPAPYLCLLRGTELPQGQLLGDRLGLWTWLFRQYISQSGKLFYAGTLRLTLQVDPASLQPANACFLGDLEAEVQQQIFSKLSSQMGYDQHLLGKLALVSMTGFFEPPLRYRMADTLNSALKKWSGPVHNALKRFSMRPKTERAPQ